MKIGVIGAGQIGRTLGEKWKTAGHDVVYGTRNPGGPGTGSVAEAATSAEVVVMAVPGAAAKEILAALGPTLSGKVLIDASNDMTSSGKLHSLDAAPDAFRVRAFNTLGWENFAEPVVGGVQADLLYAAEEGRAREVAEQLIRDVGLRPVWLGGPDAFELCDSVTRLWFALAFRRGLGRRLAFKVLTEAPGVR